jgi:hypothetical protein
VSSHRNGASERANGLGTGARPIVALVVPTRNEASHVGPFIRRVEAALEPFPFDWHAEIIDDSDDETPTLLEGLASRGAPLEIRRRNDAERGGGLGSAVRSGLTRTSGEIICAIDADLQHPPEILPELLAPIVLGRADISVGTRYRRGGSAAGLESRWRRLAARVSGAAVRRMFPATRLTSDPGSGLFAVRREVLDSVSLRPRGSRVLAEILVRGQWSTICDVPYRFAVSDGGSAHVGAAAGFALTRELVSLWRAAPRRGPSSARRLGIAQLNGSRGRRVAPVHVDLMRQPDGTTARRPVQSREGV